MSVLRFLTSLADAETYVELARQNLANESLFEPYTAFRRLDQLRCGSLTPLELSDFLLDNGVEPTQQQLIFLFNALDLNRDGLITYNDFNKAVLPRNNESLTQLVILRDSYFIDVNMLLPQPVELALTDLFKTIINSANSVIQEKNAAKAILVRQASELTNQEGVITPATLRKYFNDKDFSEDQQQTFFRAMGSSSVPIKNLFTLDDYFNPQDITLSQTKTTRSVQLENQIQLQPEIHEDQRNSQPQSKQPSYHQSRQQSRQQSEHQSQFNQPQSKQQSIHQSQENRSQREQQSVHQSQPQSKQQSVHQSQPQSQREQLSVHQSQPQSKQQSVHQSQPQSQREQLSVHQSQPQSKQQSVHQSQQQSQRQSQEDYREPANSQGSKAQSKHQSQQGKSEPQLQQEQDNKNDEEMEVKEIRKKQFVSQQNYDQKERQAQLDQSFLPLFPRLELPFYNTVDSFLMQDLLLERKIQNEIIDKIELLETLKRSSNKERQKYFDPENEYPFGIQNQIGKYRSNRN